VLAPRTVVKERNKTLMGAKFISLHDVSTEESGSALSAILSTPEDRIRRDVMMLLNPEETDSGNLQVGYTTVYPGCTTRGHSHGHLEEVYFFTHGRGVMVVGDEEREVAAGDIVYVPFGPFHTTRNPYNQPLEYFWVTTPHGAKAEAASLAAS
jgi:mannose-6-phosphate isomerase-like protein (cupin superfamily)